MWCAAPVGAGRPATHRPTPVPAPGGTSGSCERPSASPGGRSRRPFQGTRWASDTRGRRLPSVDGLSGATRWGALETPHTANVINLRKC